MHVCVLVVSWLIPNKREKVPFVSAQASWTIFCISLSLFGLAVHSCRWVSVHVRVHICSPTLTSPSVPAVNSRVCVPSSAMVEISALPWQRWICLTFWPVSASQQITEEAESLLTTWRERGRTKGNQSQAVWSILRWEKYRFHWWWRAKPSLCFISLYFNAEPLLKDLSNGCQMGIK